MGSRKNYLISNIVKICQKLDNKGFGANHDGNVSCRFEGVLLATPTSMSKGDITSGMIITLDMDGKKIEGIGKPFSEIRLHVAAYNSRDDVMAVVHAHPPFATAKGLTGKALNPELPEAVVSIGDRIPVVGYAMPGDPENDSLTANALKEADIIMMQGNGVLSTGADLEQAYLRLELVEHLAKIDFYANALGAGFTLPEEDKANLLEKRASIGLGPRGQIDKAKPVIESDDSLKRLIADEVRRVLEC